MPTARELLDQADALMRRNRSLVRDDIPVLTDAVIPETAAQTTPSGLLVEGLAAPRARLDASPEAFDELDDVPVLTEAVEEIEVPSVLEPVEPGGEPSAWLDFDEDDARSVIDAATDSIVVVPDIETPASGRGATDFDRELQTEGRDGRALVALHPVQPQDVPGGTAASAVQSEEAVFVERSVAQREDEGEQPTALQDGAVADFTTPGDEAVEESSAFRGEAGVAAETTRQAAAPVVAEEFAAPPEEPIVIEEFALQPDEPVVTEEFALQPDEPVVTEELLSQPSEFANVETLDWSARPASNEPAALAPALLAQDDARWTEMAEEIRMQVLQRIDLFTDTGLREQLGVHLQPIVDSASADLVATINREVGELLRAYVAEAIEREIERWRQEKGGIR